MSIDWSAIDTTFISTLGMSDSALGAALAASAKAGLPEIQVMPSHGKQLMLLARAIGAKRILEIGTLGGYSTIWLARSLSAGGRLVTMELDPRHAEVARGNLDVAGVGHLVDVMVAPALESLSLLANRGGPPFDFAFIDADKEQAAEYFDWAVRLSRPGAVIIVDNVIRKGAVLDRGSSDPRVQGIRRLFDQVAADRRVDATAIQTVGEKGHDGYLLAVVARH